jgi:hypothetical protein
MMRRLALSILLFLASCGSDDPLSSESLAGTYVLESAELSGGGTTLILEPPTVTGFLILTADNSYTVSISGAGIVENVSGSYLTQGSTITFISGSGGRTTNTISADSSRVTVTGVATIDGDIVNVLVVFVRT